MPQKRTFLKLALGAVVGLMATPISRVRAASAQAPWAGLIYTATDPGRWNGKEGSHAPNVKIDGRRVVVTTPHGMSKAHFIVRHTLVSASGTVLGEKTFQYTDSAVSSFDLPEEARGTLYATSFCNQHDLWVTSFDV